MLTNGYKVCLDCNLPKDRSLFSKNARKTDGLCLYCKECMSVRFSKFYQKNLERERRRSLDLRNENIESRRQYNRDYRKNNKSSLTRSNSEYVQKRSKADPSFKLRKVLRSRILHVLSGEARAGSAVRDLGCSVDELVSYLEARFYPHPVTGEAMAWANWTPKGWHVDHVIPLASFDLTNREQFLKACHYTNLQPLWAEENLRKGDRMPNA